MKKMMPEEVRYSGDGMIRFGPNCAFSVEAVHSWVKGSGPIVKNAFYEWVKAVTEAHERPLSQPCERCLHPDLDHADEGPCEAVDCTCAGFVDA